MASASIEKDPRFKYILTDPRFNRVPRHVRKVTIDPRFKGMFSDKRFKVKYTVDKRGRRVKQSSSDDLRKYYALNEEDTIQKDKDGKDEQRRALEQSPGVIDDDEKRDSHDNSDDQDGVQNDDEEEDSNAEFIDYARGEGDLESSSEEDDDDDDDEIDNENESCHDLYGLNEDIPHIEATYARLAVCNMNWDRINAQDLYVLFNSFKPQGSIIHSVKIYPSDFGLQRMAVEEIEGPVELTRDKSDDETTEGSGYSVEKLRQYQV